MTDYQRDTREAYKTPERASEYKNYHTAGWSWGRLVTSLEQRVIWRELARYRWTGEDRLLDIPCGTGVLGPTLRSFPMKIVASDVSPAMMELAKDEYPADRLLSCVTADITSTSFERGSFTCVVTLGFLHRVPMEIKRAALREIAALSSKVVIVSCSVDTRLQRVKHAVLSKLRREHVPAPCPLGMSELVAECEAQGLRLVRSFMILPFLSAHAVLVLEKR